MVAGGIGREGCNPALRMLAIGCCAKFRFGGGFAVEQNEVISNTMKSWFRRGRTIHGLFWRKPITNQRGLQVNADDGLLICMVAAAFFNIGLSSRLLLDTLSSSCFFGVRGGMSMPTLGVTFYQQCSRTFTCFIRIITVTIVGSQTEFLLLFIEIEIIINPFILLEVLLLNS